MLFLLFEIDFEVTERLKQNGIVKKKSNQIFQVPEGGREAMTSIGTNIAF